MREGQTELGFTLPKLALYQAELRPDAGFIRVFGGPMQMENGGLGRIKEEHGPKVTTEVPTLGSRVVLPIILT